MKRTVSIAAKKVSARRKSIPFTLPAIGNRTEMLAAAIREAIANGYWKAGDTLPRAVDFQTELGTGGFIPRSALRRLADEGIILLKKHSGAVVLKRPVADIRGRIAFITSGRRESYYENVHGFTLQNIFESKGYEFVHITTPRDDEDEDGSGFKPLERQLKRGIDFAICFSGSRIVAEMLDKAYVKYIYEGGTGRDFPNAAAVINIELESQDCIETLSAHWKRSKVKDVLVVDFEHLISRNVLGSMVQSGMTLRRLVVKRPGDKHYLQNIQQAGLDAIAKFFASAKNRRNPPDAIFFYDDYLAAGGLIALAATGIEIPGDMRIATFSNRGLGPVWFKPLTRLEYNPRKNSRLIGDYVLKLLAGGKITPPVLKLEFIPGET